MLVKLCQGHWVQDLHLRVKLGGCQGLDRVLSSFHHIVVIITQHRCLHGCLHPKEACALRQSFPHARGCITQDAALEPTR
eukprot:scaffold57636_cov20-Tisochrysis_lutea.AAC.1